MHTCESSEPQTTKPSRLPPTRDRITYLRHTHTTHIPQARHIRDTHTRHTRLDGERLTRLLLHACSMPATCLLHAYTKQGDEPAVYAPDAPVCAAYMGVEDGSGGCSIVASSLAASTKKLHPKKLHPKMLHPKMLHPKMLHPKKLHPKMLHTKMLHPKKLHPKMLHPKKLHPKMLHPKMLDAACSFFACLHLWVLPTDAASLLACMRQHVWMLLGSKWQRVPTRWMQLLCLPPCKASTFDALQAFDAASFLAGVKAEGRRGRRGRKRGRRAQEGAQEGEQDERKKESTQRSKKESKEGSKKASRARFWSEHMKPLQKAERIEKPMRRAGDEMGRAGGPGVFVATVLLDTYHTPDTITPGVLVATVLLNAHGRRLLHIPQLHLLTC